MKRRQFLIGGASLGAGAALGRVSANPARAAAPAEPATSLALRVPFEGSHQSGVLTERPPAATFVVFDAIAPSRVELTEALRRLSERARRLTAPHAALLGSPG